MDQVWVTIRAQAARTRMLELLDNGNFAEALGKKSYLDGLVGKIKSFVQQYGGSMPIDLYDCIVMQISTKAAEQLPSIIEAYQDHLKKQNIEYVDATCPLVKKLHHIIEKIDETNTQIVIIGDKNHPEITAAKSYAKNAVIVDSETDIEKIKKSRGIAVIGQTTLDTDHFKKMVSLLVEKADKLEVYNTICNATKVRQQAVRQLAPKVDVMVVLGNKNSSNTRKLFNIASRINKNTFYIEKSSELNDAGFID